MTKNAVIKERRPMPNSLKKPSKSVGIPCLVFWLMFNLCSVIDLFGTDWPQWRGPDRAANWTESGIVNKLPNTGLKVLWRVPIGLGFSSPVIVDGNAYVTDAKLEKPIVHEQVRWENSLRAAQCTDELPADQRERSRRSKTGVGPP